MATMLFSTSLANFFKYKKASIDSLIFKLHYKFTAIALLAASLMVTANQFFGNPIYCIVPKTLSGGPQKKFLETFCWIESTFSLPRAYDLEVGVDVVYPGVDNRRKGDDIVEHAYYQWVCLLLFLQCCMFMVPHFIWKSCEGGKIKQLLMELDKPVVAADDKKTKFVALSNYFFSQGTGHQFYFWKYFLCECLNLVNVIGQMYFINAFLHGEFTNYGSEVIKFINQEQEDRSDPMLRVFPRVTKCSYYNFGPSGDVQEHDVLCVLPLNILNEKIYVFLWFWLVILAVCTSLSVAYRILLSAWSQGRSLAMKYVCLIVDDRNLDTVLNKCSVGDWFVLYLLAKSMDKVNFKDFVDIMAKPFDDPAETSVKL